MFINNFDPIAFNFFSLEIRWYSLSYIFGIILAWFYCKKFLVKNKNELKIFDDLISYLIIGIIIGGRFGYVIFYNPFYFIKNPIEILMLWNGGMSFHGAIIGILVSTIVFAKKNNEDAFYLLDLVAVTAPIGIFLGRIANFINSELYGRVTDVFWSVKFIKVDDLSRHPSQIYEALCEGLILFFLLNFFYKKYWKKTGVVSSFFVIIYSLFRFCLEYSREPDSHLGFLYFNLTMGQILSIIFIIIGFTLFFFRNDAQK